MALKAKYLVCNKFPNSVVKHWNKKHQSSSFFSLVCWWCNESWVIVSHIGYSDAAYVYRVLLTAWVVAYKLHLCELQTLNWDRAIMNRVDSWVKAKEIMILSLKTRLQLVMVVFFSGGGVLWHCTHVYPKAGFMPDHKFRKTAWCWQNIRVIIQQKGGSY